MTWGRLLMGAGLVGLSRGACAEDGVGYGDEEGAGEGKHE